LLAFDPSSMSNPAPTVRGAPKFVDAPLPPEVDRAHHEPDPLIGFVVAGRYRITKLLGRGGMGVVYEVEHVELGKVMAMKLLSGELAKRPEVARRFAQEALLASQLSDPHSVQVFDYGVSDGLAWLVMQRIAGRTLARVLRDEGPLGAERVARLVVGITSSLAEAHERGIVHRDIKPGNVMVTSGVAAGEQAIVLDFGLAKLKSAGPSDLSGRGMVVGTPSYMPPEQVRAEPLDGRADLYALGAVMYRALTGVAPFEGKTSADVCVRQVRELPIPPHVRAPHLGIPLALSWVVMRALEKRPEDRFQSAQEMRAAVLEALGWLEPDPALDAEDGGDNLTILLVRRDDTTRVELERYERRLSRARILGRALSALFATVALAAAFLLGMLVYRLG